MSRHKIAARVLIVFTVALVMASENTFSVYEAARELCCTSQWIRVLLAEQKLAGAQKIDGQWQIPAAAIEEIRKRQAVSA